MKKRLALRLCAIILAAVFLAVMTLSFVELTRALFVVCAMMAIMAILVTKKSELLTAGHKARAGPQATSSVYLTAGGILAVIFGGAYFAWPDPDQLSHLHHDLNGRTNTTRPGLASMRTQRSFICGQTENSAYNARDQSARIVHSYNATAHYALTTVNCAAAARELRAACRDILSVSKYFEPVACAV